MPYFAHAYAEILNVENVLLLTTLLISNNDEECCP
jgi:hypothetical protein